MPSFIEWPRHWPLYKQVCFGSWEKACTALVGPCNCGAWHDEGEFEFKDGVMLRYGKQVETRERTT